MLWARLIRQFQFDRNDAMTQMTNGQMKLHERMVCPIVWNGEEWSGALRRSARSFVLGRQEPAVDFSERAGMTSQRRLDVRRADAGETAGSVSSPVDSTSLFAAFR